MIRLALALLLSSTPFVELELPALDACAAPDAIACIPLAPTDGAIRLETRVAATYVVENASGEAIALGVVGDAPHGIVALPPGAARVVVYAS